MPPTSLVFLVTNSYARNSLNRILSSTKEKLFRPFDLAVTLTLFLWSLPGNVKNRLVYFIYYIIITLTAEETIVPTVTTLSEIKVPTVLFLVADVVPSSLHDLIVNLIYFFVQFQKESMTTNWCQKGIARLVRFPSVLYYNYVYSIRNTGYNCTNGSKAQILYFS